jgi:hypothetical protein
MLGLIALFSSYDHLTIAGRNLPIPQQWGIPLIAASVAIVFVVAEGFCEAVAQLATGSRLRAANETTRERNFASEERWRAEQREQSWSRKKSSCCRRSRPEAMARERQRKSFERLDQAALLSARVQLDPSDTNRGRLQTFLTLISNPFPDDGSPAS